VKNDILLPEIARANNGRWIQRMLSTVFVLGTWQNVRKKAEYALIIIRREYLCMRLCATGPDPTINYYSQSRRKCHVVYCVATTAFLPRDAL